MQIRNNIETVLMHVSIEGSITMEDLIAVLPFGGTFDLVQINGSALREAFEHSVRRYGGSTGEFLQVSGIVTTVHCELLVNSSNLSTGIPLLLLLKMT